MPPKSKGKYKGKPHRSRIILEKYQCYFLTLVLTPGYYCYCVSVMLPKLVKLSIVSSFTYWVHLILGTYEFVNVAGNMLLSICTDPRLKGYNGPGTYCDICEQNRPERTWHCTICNVCVFDRDHHCCFLSHCVGRKNLRYFILMLFHLSVSLSYSLFYTSFVIASEFNFRTFIDISLIILCPMRAIGRTKPDVDKIVFILFLYLELFLLPASLILFSIHMRNVVKGWTAFECLKRKAPNNEHWKSNVEYVIGKRWYLAVFWPFFKSPLPKCIDA